MKSLKETTTNAALILVIALAQSYISSSYSDNSIIFMDKLVFEKPYVLISQIIMFALTILLTMRYLVSTFSNEGLNYYIRVKSVSKLLFVFYRNIYFKVFLMILLQVATYTISYHVLTTISVLDILTNYSVLDFVNYYLCIVLYVIIANICYYLFKSMVSYFVIIVIIMIESFRIIQFSGSLMFIPLWTVETNSIMLTVILQILIYFISHFFVKKGDILDANRSY